MRHARGDYNRIQDGLSFNPNVNKNFTIEDMEELNSILPDISKLIKDDIHPIGLMEPVFLLRAKDILMPKTLRYWVDCLEQTNGDPKMIAMVREHADLTEKWQKQNGCTTPNL